MKILPFGTLRWGVHFSSRCFSILFVFSVVTSSAVAATNIWAKTISGNWEEQAFWSLGVLPNATQDVLFTNAGFKALGINPQTAQNFPQSMTVQTLRVGAPVNSSNTLLMNFSGFLRPLRAGALTVDTNGAFRILSSSLEVMGSAVTTGDILVSPGGGFQQGSLALVNVSRLRVGGSYFLTNGTLTVNFLENFGRFFQFGGTNRPVFMQVFGTGQYQLQGGNVGGSLQVLDGGSFFQSGGNVTADLDVGGDFPTGRYVLSNGVVTGRMTVPSARGTGIVEQYGGTNAAVSLDIGNGSRFGGLGTYVLSNGVVNVGSSTTLRGFGNFEQWNGSHTITVNLVMSGTDLFQFGIANASYSLRGGILSAAGLTMNIAIFLQQGGSNRITGDVVIGPASQSSLYMLSGGFLATSNVILNGSVNSGFDQAGGTNNISSTLRITGQGTNFHGYTMSGGTLNVNNISISNGAAFHHTGGVINHTNLLMLAGGHWQARTGSQTLGRMRLAGGTEVNSSIDFPGGGSVLRFANSSGEPWNPGASLFITNWHGSASGGGDTQLFFGANANGLTSQQLALIKFALSGGLFPAQILASGEIVPQNQQLLTFSRSGNTMTFTWGAGWFLQASTNVVGPYLDVPGAVSPYSVSMTNPAQFFRLRQ